MCIVDTVYSAFVSSASSAQFDDMGVNVYAMPCGFYDMNLYTMEILKSQQISCLFMI